jgi:hypothetical protein
MTSRLPALVLLLAAACCTDGEVRKDEVPKRPPPTLRLLVMTDLAGTLEPCGCTSRPLGGIDRMAAAVGAARGQAAPTLLVSAGDLFFGPGPHHPEGGVPTQEVWKAEALAGILSDLGVHGATLGTKDVIKGAAHLPSLLAKSRFPVLGAGLPIGAGGGNEAPDGAIDGDETADGGAPDAPAPPLPATVVHEVAGLQVALVGVVAPDPATRALPAFAGLDDPLAEARRAAAAAREAGADLVVALSAGDRRIARQLAGEATIDLVVQGGLDEDDPVPPMAAGGGLVLHAARHGRGLLVVDVWRRGDGGSWTDVGELGRQSEQERLEQAAKALRARIAEWEADSDVKPDDLEAQRARLKDLEGQIGRAARPRPVPEDGNVVAARYQELPDEAPRDPKVTAALDAFFRRVNDHNREAFADLAPPPVPEGGAGYVGSETCGGCHGEAHRWWTGTPHGNAYATLVKRHKEFNLDCVSCHVTGYGKPGGATVTHVADLKNVGCESCHGPGSVHVESGGASLAHMRTEVPERVCVACHNEEHSDLFVYEAYRRTLIVPGHGLPPRAAPVE